MKMENHKIFMQQAIELASANASSVDGGPFGALIVKNGVVLSACTNSVTPHCDPTAHAEVNAIREACSKIKSFSLEGCTLYSSCEPCPMCLSAAYWARVDRIFFAADRSDAANAGFSDDFIYRELAADVTKRSIPIERMMEEEGTKPFELWNDNEKKVRY